MTEKIIMINEWELNYAKLLLRKCQLLYQQSVKKINFELFYDN